MEGQVTLLEQGWKYYDNILNPKQRKLLQESIADITSSKDLQSLATFDPMRGNVIQHGDLEVYKEFHSEMGNFLSSTIGVKFNPSHTWRTVYLNNSYMVPHRDNEEFAFTLSLPIGSNIDKVVEDRKFTFWMLDYDNAIQGLNIFPGCGVFYYGKEIMHWRNPLICNNDSYFAVLMLSYRVEGFRQEDFSKDKFYLDYDHRMGYRTVHRNYALSIDGFNEAISQGQIGAFGLEPVNTLSSSFPIL
jgi:hypothetical protein